VRASVAIPGLFSPINVDGRYLLDGGLVNPVPVSACRALGARTIIGVDPNAKHGRRLWSPSDDTGLLDALGGRDFMARLPNALRRFLPDGAGDEDTSEAPDLIDVMSTSIDIVTEYIRKTREAADPADLMLEADLPDLTILEFDRAQHAIDEGRRITQAALARRTASSADR
jgi:NTE family protein